MAYQALHYLSPAYFANILTLHLRYFIICDYGCISPQIWQTFSFLCAFASLSPSNSSSSSLLTKTIHILKSSFSWCFSPEHLVSFLSAHSTSIYATVIELLCIYFSLQRNCTRLVNRNHVIPCCVPPTNNDCSSASI